MPNIIFPLISLLYISSLAFLAIYILLSCINIKLLGLKTIYIYVYFSDCGALTDNCLLPLKTVIFFYIHLINFNLNKSHVYLFYTTFYTNNLAFMPIISKFSLLCLFFYLPPNNYNIILHYLVTKLRLNIGDCYTHTHTAISRLL